MTFDHSGNDRFQSEWLVFTISPLIFRNLLYICGVFCHLFAVSLSNYRLGNCKTTITFQMKCYHFEHKNAQVSSLRCAIAHVYFESQQ